MTAVQCQIDIPNVQGLKNQELTVGREFYLNCRGDWPRDLAQEKLQLIFPEQAKYQIQLLGFEFRTPEEADIKITTHKVVPAKFENLKITDGTKEIELGVVQYQVQTVIEKPEDPSQKVEPFGPMGPALVAMPMVYIVVVSLLVLSVLSLAATKVYRLWQRRQLLAKLKAHDSALSPLGEFHQQMRRLQRDNTVFFGGKSTSQDVVLAFEELNSSFRMFLIRELHVPAFDWGSQLILKDIKKYHHLVYQDCSLDIKKLLREYDQAINNKNTLIENDIRVLFEQTRRLVEKVDQLKHQGVSK